MPQNTNQRWIAVFAAILILFAVSTVFAQDSKDCKDCIDCECVFVKTVSIEEDGAFLGVYPADLDDTKREALDFEGEGVLIEDIVEDGPAQKAGVEAGDIIIKMDDKAIASNDELRKILKKRKPGDKMKILVSRDGEKMEFTLELVERPEEAFTYKTAPHFGKMKKGAFLGVEIIGLEEQLAEYFGVKEGVLVEEVEEESPAEKAGIKAGDVIVKIADEEIEDIDDLVEEIRSHDPGTEVKVGVVRKGKKKTLTAILGEKEYQDWGHWNKEFDFDFDEDDFDPGHIKRVVKEALENLDINIDMGREELEESMQQLKEEMKKLKEEMKKLKKEK